MLTQQNLMQEGPEQLNSFTSPMLNKIQLQSSRFKNIITQLRLSKRKSLAQSSVTPFNLQNQCQISNIEPVSEKLDKNSFQLDLPIDPQPRRNAITLSFKNKHSEKQIGDAGLKYKPRGGINGRDDIRIRNISQIHKMIKSKNQQKNQMNKSQHQNQDMALSKFQNIQNPESVSTSHQNFYISKSRTKFHYSARKNNDSGLNSKLHNETQRIKVGQDQKNFRFKKHTNQQKLMINQKQLLQYLKTVPSSKHPSTDCSPTKIYQFFIGICNNFEIDQLFYQPLIKRYKNCVYFGQKVANYGSYIGFVWYFRRALYYGQFQKGRKNGYGIQVDIQEKGSQCIWRGTFQNGKKTGYFQLISPKIQYHGSLVNSYFEGQGMLHVKGHSTYKGTFSSGMKQGFGVQNFQAKKLSYKGEYNENKFEGKGQLEGPNYLYKGYFRNNKTHGQGFQRTEDYQYQGSFKNGKRNGNGVLKLKNGQKIQGYFQNNQLIKQTNKQVPNNVTSKNQYIKNIKIQSVRKLEQQNSMNPSSMLQQQSKMKPPSYKTKQQKVLPQPQESHQLISNFRNHKIQNTKNSNKITQPNAYTNRIVPLQLQKHLSKRLKSLYQQNENSEATIDPNNKNQYLQREAHHNHNNNQNFKRNQSKAEHIILNFEKEKNANSIYNQYSGQIPQAGASDDEDQPLQIRIIPKQ